MSNKATSEKSSPTSTQSSNQPAAQPTSPANSYPKHTYRAHNGYDTKHASDDATYDDPGESLTIQAHAEDADINVLMRRYGITGKMPDNPKIPTYGDFTGITDYRSAVEAVRQAHEAFMEIPAEIRSKFDNNPQALLEYASNPANTAGMVELGLAKWRQPPTPPEPSTATPQPGQGTLPTGGGPGPAPGTGT